MNENQLNLVALWRVSVNILVASYFFPLIQRRRWRLRNIEAAVTDCELWKIVFTTIASSDDALLLLSANNKFCSRQ